MKKTKWISILLIAVLLLFGCAKKDDGIDAQVSVKNPVSGGVLKIYSQKPDTYNPLITKITSVSKMLSLIYEPLYTLDTGIKPVAVLARTYNVSSDGLTYSIFLQENVTYQDGSAFTAKDVVYTVHQIKDTDSVYKSNLYNVENITAVSDYQVDIKLKTRDSNFLSLLTFPIIKDGSAASTTVGTGPYQITQLADQKKLELNTYENWHGAHKPYIEQIEVVILDDAQAASNAFQINLIDAFELPYDYADQITVRKKSGNVVIPTNILTFLGINSTHPILNDPKIRTALSMLVDKEQIISQVLFTNASLTNIPIHPDYYLYPKGYNESMFNVKNAEDMLKSVGFADKNKNGILERTDIDGNKQSLDVTLLVCEGDTRRLQMGEMLASMFKEGGVGCTLQTVSYEDYTSKISNGEYDLYVGNISLLNNFDLSGLLIAPPQGRSLSGYQNDQTASYFSAVQMATDDTLKAAAYEQFADFFKQETPFIPICFNDNVFYYNSNLNGVSELYFETPYQNCYDWFMSPDNSKE